MFKSHRAIGLIALPLVALMTPTPAQAATATMTGSFWVNPDYATITTPDGPLVGEPLEYNAIPSQEGIEDAYRATGEWLETLDRDGVDTDDPADVLAAYSLSTHAVVGRMREDPDSLKGVHVYLFGAPETTGNGNKGIGYHGETGMPTSGDFSNVTVVVAQYDAVADRPTRVHWYSLMNSSMAVHINGYDGLDLNNPDEVYTDPDTGITTLYYRTDVLPLLKGLDPWVSDDKMAELDAKWRALIEADYDRPVGTIEHPVVEPQPEPEPQTVTVAHDRPEPVEREDITADEEPAQDDEDTPVVDRDSDVPANAPADDDTTDPTTVAGDDAQDGSSDGRDRHHTRKDRPRHRFHLFHRNRDHSSHDTKEND